MFSQFFLAAAVSSVTGRRGDSDRKGGRRAPETDVSKVLVLMTSFE